MTNYLFVIDKIYKILADDKKLAKKFYAKWGVDLKDFKRKITDPLTHGGYISKVTSLQNLSIDNNTRVLNIGPEMGLEVYMLSEIAGEIVVCDPDIDNLDLIKNIASLYMNEGGKYINNILRYEPIGFNNTSKVLVEERERYHSIVSKLGHSLPTFYNVTSEGSLDNLEGNSFDLVFIHKILTTITRSGECDPFEVFDNAINEITNLLKTKKICSWSEPKFVFEQKGIMQRLNEIKDVEIQVIEYHPKELPEKYVQLLITKL